MSLASDLAGPIASDACDRAARTIINGFEFCAEQGYPLNDLQKIALVSAAMACFDGITVEAARGLTVGAHIRSPGLERVDETDGA